MVCSYSNDRARAARHIGDVWNGLLAYVVLTCHLIGAKQSIFSPRPTMLRSGRLKGFLPREVVLCIESVAPVAPGPMYDVAMRGENAQGKPIDAGQIVQSLAALIAAAYVAGWAFYLAYYATFGALWLLPHVSAISLLRGSAGPLIVLLLVLAFVVGDIVYFSGTTEPAHVRFARVAFARERRIGSAFFVALLIIGGVTIGTLIGSALAVGLLLSLAALVVNLIAVENTMRPAAPHDSRVRSAMIALLASIVVLPAGIGFVSAGLLRALNFETLPSVYETSRPGQAAGAQVGRLLLSTDQRVFVARRVDGKIYVTPVEWADVEKITP